MKNHDNSISEYLITFIMSSPALDLLSHPYHKHKNLGRIQIQITINIKFFSQPQLFPLNVITTKVGIRFIIQNKLLLNLNYKLLSQYANNILNLCIDKYIKLPLICD